MKIKVANSSELQENMKKDERVVNRELLKQNVSSVSQVICVFLLFFNFSNWMYHRA